MSFRRLVSVTEKSLEVRKVEISEKLEEGVYQSQPTFPGRSQFTSTTQDSMVVRKDSLKPKIALSPQGSLCPYRHPISLP